MQNNNFETKALQYDMWFEKHCWVYDAELRAVSSLFEQRGKCCIEIGVGTGRFGKPLGVKIGVDPSVNMGVIAREKGITVVRGIAENLPFKDSVADGVLMVTVICFVSNIISAFRESFRILSKGGSILVGMVDRNSKIGKEYTSSRQNVPFYYRANFQSVDDVIVTMKETGFKDFHFRQTIFQDPSKITDYHIVKEGYGQGLFVAIRALKK